MKSLDYETSPQINLTIVATDQGTPRRTAKSHLELTVLDLNDQKPKFTQASFSIQVSEATPTGQMVGDLKANDFESGQNGQFDVTVVPGTVSFIEQSRWVGG